MHSSRELRSADFAISAGGRPVGLPEVLDGFGAGDRLGAVIRTPCGAVGASTLILAAVTAFYDVQRAGGEDFFIYPDFFLFHVGRPLGDHSMLDVWPGHKEVVVTGGPDALLEAINDRGITHLAVEDGPPGEPPQRREALASARSRIRACVAFSPTGRVAGGDVRIAGSATTEGYVAAVLDPDGLVAEAGPDDPYARAVAARAGETTPDERERLRAARAALAEDGVPVETYRRIGLDEALGLLGAQPALTARGA
jgi:hypothetical protein